MEFTVSIDIHASAEKIWSELIDVERWPEWTPSMLQIDRLDDHQFGKSSQARVKQPKLMPMIWTVTDFDPGRSFTWTAEGRGITSIGEHRLSPSDGQTVTVTLAIHQTGPLAPIVALFTSGITRRYLSMEAHGLKQRCETK